ncbi:predicted protein [Thalassiosira pseudonana CCMP1335]|uniref:uridine/cytidine kinase n=1 Tax=Thalassiosira pseudonana TaxID=35128 RepID=B8C4B7_THAPS|nr:predicted protein [Thalassiosira pseudonana CCMP1335]EED91695.1 predicted protein [Thalassiosira pseudonana CCMP1335]
MTTTKKPLVIGVAGGTGAGKTTLARNIYAHFGAAGSTSENDCAIAHLSHDDYYRDIGHLSFEERAKTNFDHPSSLDTDLLIHHVKELLEGRSVVCPRYDFSRHCRYKDGEVDSEGRNSGRVVESKRVILVEGILILSDRELVNLMDLKVFVDASADIRLMRRIQRDTVERGRTLPEIMAQYSTTVRPMHNEFVEPSKDNADLIVHGHAEDESVSRKRMDLAMRVICSYLQTEADL